MGNMFNDIRFGGYLIWKFYPQKQVFIDGRLVIRSPRFFADFLAVCKYPELFDTVAKRYSITHVILPTAIFDQYHSLIQKLYKSSDWRIEYTDGASVLFVKSNIPNRSYINLSDTLVIRKIAEEIKEAWKSDTAVQKEALGYFADQLKLFNIANKSVL